MGGEPLELGFLNSSREASVQEPDGRVLGCLATLWGGTAKLPCKFSLQYPGKEKKCPLLSYRIVGTLQMGYGLYQPYQEPLGTVLWEEEEVARSRDIQSVRISEAIV